MPSTPIANDQLTLSISPPAVTGSISMTSTPSSDSNAGGGAIHRGDLVFNVTNVQSPPMGTATPGTATNATISPTAQSVRINGEFVLRPGDQVSLTAADATKPAESGTGTVPSPISFTVKIDDAGQTSCLAS